MRYLGLLRGVNVGGKNRVPMNQLKSCFEKAGFHNIMTYINSGNIIFNSDEKDISSLQAKCVYIMEKEFGFLIDLAVIDALSLKEALEHAPEWWGSDPESKHNAIFVIQPATAEEVIADAGMIKPEYENLYAYKSVIFWSAAIKTFSKTRWSKVVGTKVYKSITIRNANTVKTLLELV